MYKGRKETTHERVGERKTYNNIIEEKISTMYVYKWSQDLMYKNNVSKNMLAIIFKAFLIFWILIFFFAYFSFKYIMHGHIRERKEIPNDI